MFFKQFVVCAFELELQVGQRSELSWLHDAEGALVSVEYCRVAILKLAVLDQLCEGLGEGLEIYEQLLVLF